MARKRETGQRREMRGKRRACRAAFAVAAFALVLAASAQAASVTLNPTQDSYVSSSFPDNNYNEIYVAFGEATTTVFRAYLKFDVSSIPSGSTITSATLRLYREDNWNDALRNFLVSRIASNWTETGPTWNTRPNRTATPTATGFGGTPGTTGWISWTDGAILSWVQLWVDGSYANYGFEIRKDGTESAGEEALLKCTSREGSSAYWPELVISYTPPATPPSKATNPSPSNGASGVSVTVDPSWSNGGGATSYLVYFGTDSTPDSGEYKGEQTSTSYNPGTLSYSTTYYWRIDAKNSSGTTTGDVWSFTTEPPAVFPTIAVGTSQLLQSCTEGTDASSECFTVRNSGTGTLSYSISDDVAWLSCSPTTGTSTGEYDLIWVDYISSTLPVGLYSATIEITDAGATNSPQTVDVLLTVNAVPPPDNGGGCAPVEQGAAFAWLLPLGLAVFALRRRRAMA